MSVEQNSLKLLANVKNSLRDAEKKKETHTHTYHIPSHTPSNSHPSTLTYNKTCQQMAKVARNLHNAGLISTRATETATTAAQAETEVVRKSVEINFKGKLVTTCTTKHTHTHIHLGTHSHNGQK